MALLHRDPTPRADAPPLWLPRHDDVVVDQASARPPDFVEGYTVKSRLMAAFLGSPTKMSTIGATAVAVIAFLALLPSLLGAGIFSLVKLGFYQAWTIGLILLIGVRVRSVTVGTVARFWLAGIFLVAMLAWLINDPIAGLIENGTVWITPVVEELLALAPIGVAILMGRRTWRHPGLTDLLLLGFAVGAGYAFHEQALREDVVASGFGLDAGLAIPSIVHVDGLFVVGHAVWTALLAFAVGLFILHRRNPAAAVGAVVIVVAVTADRMSVNDTAGTLTVVRQLLFDGRISAVGFILAAAAAVALDHRRLAATAARDHLFPSAHTHGPKPVDGVDDDPLASVLAARYRRLRNGVHTTVDATTQQWPPRSEAHPPPLAELARLGRAADVAVGPGTSPYGWAGDAESPGGHRFVGPNGFTAYAVADEVVEPVAVPAVEVPDGPDLASLEAALADPDLDEDSRARLAAQYQARVDADAAAAAAEKAVAVGPTAASISVPKSRPEARGSHDHELRPDFWRYVVGGVAGIALLAAVRVYTAGEASAIVLDAPVSLADAPQSPALIVGVLGALATVVSIRGRDAAELDEGWNVGPGDVAVSDRFDECEA